MFPWMRPKTNKNIAMADPSMQGRPQALDLMNQRMATVQDPEKQFQKRKKSGMASMLWMPLSKSSRGKMGGSEGGSGSSMTWLGGMR